MLLFSSSLILIIVSARLPCNHLDLWGFQVTQMLIAVVLLFILCWTPFVVDDLLSAFRIVCTSSHSEALKYMRMAFAIMAYSNSCVNPVVYAFMSQNFRATFTMTTRRCCKRKDEWRRREFESSLHQNRRISARISTSRRTAEILYSPDNSRRNSHRPPEMASDANC